MIPKSTAPLVKFIRTGEGVLAYVFGLVLILVPIITNNLPPALSASLAVGKWLAIAAVVSRSGLKAIALISGQTAPASAETEVSAVLRDIAHSQPATAGSWTGTRATGLTAPSTATIVEKPESAVKPDPPADPPPDAPPAP